MLYHVEIEGREYEVDLTAESLRVDGRPVAASLRAVGEGLWHLLLDGRSYTLRALGKNAGGAWEIELGGRPLRVVVLDERRRAIRELTGAAATKMGRYEVLAPMAGLVITVRVSPEDRVSSGQGLVIIEAMKMENEIKATAAGVVTDVRVVAGQTVNKGDALVVIDAGGDAGRGSE